jgi:hypothetical protein
MSDNIEKLFQTLITCNTNPDMVSHVFEDLFQGRIVKLEDARGARIGPETMKRRGW